MQRMMFIGLMLLWSVAASSQTAIGMWAEDSFNETYIRHDWKYGHLLYERFQPSLDQLTVGFGKEPDLLEGQVRADDAGRAWVGFAATYHTKQTSLQFRPLLSLNGKTPGWMYLTLNQVVRPHHGVQLYLLGKKGLGSDMYFGPTYSKGNTSFWVGFGLNNPRRFVINLHLKL